MAEKGKSVIMGVDTHKEVHVVALVSEQGVKLDHKAFEADALGYREALKWARAFGKPLRVGIEATGSYGKGICTYFQKEGVKTYDVYAPDKQERRRRGKNDIEDAYQAAEAALTYNRCAQAKQNSDLLDIARLTESAYELAVKQRTASINALKAAIITLPEKMRARLKGLSTSELVKVCVAFRASSDGTYEAELKVILRHHAKRIQALKKEAADLEKSIKRYANVLAPETMSLLGVGCHGAVKLLCAAGQNIDRMKGEASFSMLCGTSPVPVSSGNNNHHRLNIGGNRQANSALYTMAIIRIRRCEKTRNFVERKMAEGKSKKDALRILKRYLAREVFGMLKADLAKFEYAV